jgi:hypothetical protein
MRTFLAMAIGWHILWGALLLPYAVVIALLVGGQAAAQDLVDNLASTFFLPVLFVVVALPPNLLLAAMTERLLTGTRPDLQLGTSAAIFGVAWLVAVQALLPIIGGFSLNPIAIWAALAGATYGLILPMLQPPVADRAG